MTSFLSRSRWAVFLLLITATEVFSKEEVYLDPEVFIENAFEGEPEESVLWLNREVKESAERILGRSYKGLRVRYWKEDARTAWILEEIGKVEPITAGFIVEDNRLNEIKILIYRESHGWEVRYPFFTRQFSGLGLDDDMKLDNRIDGISGATLSVGAIERLSRLALYFHSEVQK